MFNPDKPVQTRGNKNVYAVEILATDIHGSYPIVAKLTYADGVKIIRHYTIEGLEQYGCERLDDLVNIPETHVRYINFAILGSGSVYLEGIFDTESQAIDCKTSATVSIKRVEFKEGQFDE